MKILDTSIGKFIWYSMVKLSPKLCIKIMYKHILKKNINLDNPQDLNEKINYLKLHADLNEWAQLADKYSVRKYIEERGLANILVPLYGKYSSAENLLKDWNTFPEPFIIKSNNGCGTIFIVKDKKNINISHLKKILENWLTKKDIGIGTVELHYTLIKPLLIVEKFIEDDNIGSFSKSLIDYKIWCFNGKPFCCFVAYDRDLEGKNRHAICDTYDTNWEIIPNSMIDNIPKQKIPCPTNWNLMLEYASILSKGHKQVRIDLYNVNGNIYFGEMTFTGRGGYMVRFTPTFLKEMGAQFNV